MEILYNDENYGALVSAMKKLDEAVKGFAHDFLSTDIQITKKRVGADVFAVGIKTFPNELDPLIAKVNSEHKRFRDG